MRIAIVTAEPTGAHGGNRVTARRWAGLLRGLGHRVRVTDPEEEVTADLLVALHARRSARAVRRFQRRLPGRPVVVALTGTDVYQDLGRVPATLRTLEDADRIVALQPHALGRLPPRLRARGRVIVQSARPPGRAPRASRRGFPVCLLAHLRTVKDPFLPVRALAHLPPGSQVRLVHAGAAVEASMARRARAHEAREGRYRWLGPLSHARALRLLGQSRLLVLPSRLEGGANVLSEALVRGVPVLATRIPAATSLLGARYPGLFAPGDARALAALLARAEREPAFLARLAEGCRRAAAALDPAREQRAWEALLRGLEPRGPSSCGP